MAATLAMTEEFPDDDLERRFAEINMGELRFLAVPPQKRAHHHHNRIVIDEGSLDSGWVRLTQCHEHLDPVGDLEIVFNPQRIKNIAVTEYQGMDEATARANLVELQNVGKGARLCLTAESQALHKTARGFALKNGPYMRRFLDGYFPMRITIDIRYPETLQLIESNPKVQPGYSIQKAAGKVKASGWFEGKLYTMFLFAKP